MRICDQCTGENTSQARHCRHCGGSLRQAIELHDPDTIVGQYRIIRLIGKGGFGAVYEAQDVQNPSNRVALKETFNPIHIRSFKAEFDVLCKIQHDCLPHYYKVFKEGGSGYLVMELVPGTSLDEVIRQQQGKPLAEAQVMGYTWQLCEVLTFLHSQSPPLFHRDLKPANIRLRQDGLIKLVDFGLLKQGFDATRSSRMGLSPAYAPLEQYGGTGAHTDQRSDIYSLGATLYHLLTGQVPPAATYRSTTNTDPFIPPVQHNPRITPHLSAAIVQAMAIKAEDRYQSIGEFRQAMMTIAQPSISPMTTDPTLPVPPQSPSPTQPPRHFHYDPQEKTVPPPRPPSPPADPTQPRGKGLGWLVLVAVLAVVLIGVGGVGLWLTRDGITTLPPAMVEIDGGMFVIGKRSDEAGDDDENNEQPVTVGSFAIGRYEITNAQYKLFMDDGGYDAGKPWWNDAGRAWLQRDDQNTEGLQDWQIREHKNQPEWWDDENFGIAHPNHPVVGISWYEAVAFCRWLTQHSGYNPKGYIYRLPTEAEWEYAARRDTRRIYPWGNEEPDGERANYSYDGSPGMTTAVGSFPKGATQDKIYDMAGNVWEWTSSIYKAYPYDPNDGRGDLSNPASSRFVARGGGWLNPSDSLRASDRYNTTPDLLSNNLGFRLARHLP